MALDKLSVINAMLASTGMAPLTANDNKHPRYKQASSKLDEIDVEFQTTGWWFNTTTKTLFQNGNGEIPFALNALHIDPIDRSKRYIMRGLKLWDLTEGTFIINEDVDVNVKHMLPFEELPPLARAYLLARARHDYFLDRDGTNPKLQRYAQMAQSTWDALKSEHLKNADVNFFDGAASNWYRTAYHSVNRVVARQPT